MLLSLPSLGKRVGITVSRYDFSEPQAGKDICDRRIVPVKSHIRRYINEGHDVKSAAEMKVAIESHLGVKGCYAAVCQVSTSSQTMVKHNMTGIKSLNNFEFEAGGARVWRAYNIGPGKFFTSAELKKFGNPQGRTSLRILQPFSQPSRPVGALRLAQPGPSSGEEPAHPQEEQPTCESTEVSQFACPEEGCVKVYQSCNTLQRHLDVGKHLLKLERETTYDEMKRKWTATCKSVTGSYVRGEASTSTSNPSTSGAKLGPRIDA